MLNVNAIENVFQYFYCKKYGNKIIPSRTKTTKKVCESFLELLDKEYKLPCVGKTFIWEYFLFQFNYWDELSVNKYSDKISIAYIVGKKAFTRYLDRNKDYDWQIDTYPIVDKYSLSKSDLDIFFDKINFETIDSTKNLRKLFHNTDRGFATCIEFTTLYQPANSLCITCIFKTDCKELKRVNY